MTSEYRELFRTIPTHFRHQSPSRYDRAGNQPIDPFAQHARQQALAPDDPVTEQFKAYQARRNAIGNGPTPYDNIPKDQIYDTVIVARASLEGATDELKVVAVVHSGDDVRRAKELVAEEIANAVLH